MLSEQVDPIFVQAVDEHVTGRLRTTGFRNGYGGVAFGPADDEVDFYVYAMPAPEFLDRYPRAIEWFDDLVNQVGDMTLWVNRRRSTHEVWAQLLTTNLLELIESLHFDSQTLDDIRSHPSSLNQALDTIAGATLRVLESRTP